MTYFTDRFKNHEVHDEVAALDESIDTAKLDLPDGDARDGYDRFLRVFEFVKRSLNDVDPELVSKQALNNLNSQIHSLNEHHEAFKQNKEPAPLNQQADQVLNHLHLLPRVSAGAKEYSAALEDLRRRANKVVDDLRGRQEEVDQVRNATSKELEALKEAIDQQDSSFELQKGRVDELITNQQAKFNEEQQQRNTQANQGQQAQTDTLNTLTEKAEQKIDALITEKGQESDTQREKQHAHAENLMEALQEHLDHAAKIVGLIGNTGMTGHYQKVANRELRSAGIFRGLAVLFFVLMVVGVGWVVKEIKTEDFSWEVALFRVVVALTLLAPAFYCARESTRHRRTENRNRRIELELASINPYLESLTEEKARSVIESLAPQYFGKEVTDTEVVSGGRLNKMSHRQLLNLIEGIAKALRP